MDDNYTRHHLKKSAALLLGFTLLAAIALLVFCLPRDKRETLSYEVGRPWQYSSLIAPFDFPIYKAETDVQAERDSLLDGLMPFYTLEENTGEALITKLRMDYQSGKFGNVSANVITHLVKQLQTVYVQGLISAEEMAELREQELTNIRIVQGQRSTITPIDGILSTRTAYQQVMNADTLHYRRELLLHCNVNDYLMPNLVLDTAKTISARNELLQSVSETRGMVQQGQRIVDQGEIVNATTYGILHSYERELAARHGHADMSWWTLLGQALYVMMVLGFFMVYLRVFRPRYLQSPRYAYLLLTLVILFPVLTAVGVSHNLYSPFILPLTMAAFFVRIFMDARTSFMLTVITVFLSALSVSAPFEFIVIETASGLTAIYMLKDLTKRSEIFHAVGGIFLTSLLICFACDLAQGINLSTLSEQRYLQLTAAALLLLFAYPLLYLIEKLFGLTSSVTLAELANTNNRMLRQLSEDAPGTYQHSQQVANLAERVAMRLKANARLVYTGALYHDIGKMENPAFFTENQSGTNPHDILANEEQSANIIRAHISAGIKMAEKNHLPRVIIDLIRTHHGKGKVKYFYIQWRNKHPEEELTEEQEHSFTYPGPNPQTKEQAILMMCDSVEAASRSLKTYTDETIRSLVHNIVDGQVKEGFFAECPITFRDIKDAKDELVECLKHTYHTRIEYPELNAKPTDKTDEDHRDSHGPVASFASFFNPKGR